MLKLYVGLVSFCVCLGVCVTSMGHNSPLSSITVESLLGMPLRLTFTRFHFSSVELTD